MVLQQSIGKNSKIFVAGGTGLVGSAIIENLLSKGYTNIISNYRNRLPKDSLKIEHIKLDLLNSYAVEKFFEIQKPEFVFLAAAKVGGIVANNTYRADFIYENLQVQNNVIHQSYKHGVKKLLFLGSTCIYPKNAPQPMSEDSLLTSALEYTNEPYAIAKIAGIKMCESYNLQYGTNFLSVMPTNLYGPNDSFDLKKSHVLPALIRKVYLGKCLEKQNFEEIRKDLDKNPIENIDGKSSKEEIIEKLSKYGVSFNINTNKVQIEIWGTGMPKREFMYSKDMADACVYIMENIDFTYTYESNLKEVRNTHINIGTGKDISIKELSQLVKTTIGFNGDFYFDKNKPDGTMIKLTDPSKLHSLGWKHKIELEDGIKKMYEWYQEENNK